MKHEIKHPLPGRSFACPAKWSGDQRGPWPCGLQYPAKATECVQPRKPSRLSPRTLERWSSIPLPPPEMKVRTEPLELATKSKYQTKASKCLSRSLPGFRWWPVPCRLFCVRGVPLNLTKYLDHDIVKKVSSKIDTSGHMHVVNLASLWPIHLGTNTSASPREGRRIAVPV